MHGLHTLADNLIRVGYAITTNLRSTFAMIEGNSRDGPVPTYCDKISDFSGAVIIE